MPLIYFCNCKLYKFLGILALEEMTNLILEHMVIITICNSCTIIADQQIKMCDGLQI